MAQGKTAGIVTILVLISTAALAIDPAYLGVWAEAMDQCGVYDRRAFRITPEGMTGIELTCETREEAPEDGGWRRRLRCGSEGTESILVLHWRMAADGRLLETQEGGQSFEYVRCPRK